jgi:hypothetical protein
VWQPDLLANMMLLVLMAALAEDLIAVARDPPKSL